MLDTTIPGYRNTMINHRMKEHFTREGELLTCSDCGEKFKESERRDWKVEKGIWKHNCEDSKKKNKLIHEERR